MEVLEPFIEVVTPGANAEHVHNFDIDSPVKNALGGCLTMNKLSTCINIMHSFSFVFCMPHNFLSFYLQNVIST